MAHGTSRTKSIDIGDEPAGSSSVSSVFTLCNSAIGAGVLSLPYAFRKSGALGCFLLCLVLGACEAFTLYVLSKFAERYQAHTYSVLVRKALGRKLSAGLSLILLLYLWGSCIAYLVIIGDSFSPLLALATGESSFLADRRLVIATLGLLVILPLCFPRELGALAWVSMAAVVGFLYTATVIVIRGTQIVAARPSGHRFDDVALFRWDFGALFAIPIVVFGFNCHANVVTIFTELEFYPRALIAVLPSEPAGFAALPGPLAPRPRTHKLIGMLSVILAAIGLIMAGYLAVGFTGYLAFPTTVGGNVLNSFSANNLLMQVARGVIGAVVVGHYPLNHHPARLAMEDLEAYAAGWHQITLAFSVFQSTLFVVSSIGVACLVTDLGAVLHMVGGTAASFMIFFLPGMLLLNAAIVKESASQADLAAHCQDAAEAGGPGDGTARPLLASPNERGIKRVGIIYSPRKSWWAGATFVGLSITILVITLVTAFTD